MSTLASVKHTELSNCSPEIMRLQSQIFILMILNCVNCAKNVKTEMQA